MFFLFAGADYYPGGGMVDHQGVFPTIEAAQQHFAVHKEDWAHIATIKDGKLVWLLEWEKHLDPGANRATYAWRKP